MDEKRQRLDHAKAFGLRWDQRLHANGNDAINEALTERHAVVGGTSAGMAILGGLRFTAANGTVYSNEALDDP